MGGRDCYTDRSPDVVHYIYVESTYRTREVGREAGHICACECTVEHTCECMLQLSPFMVHVLDLPFKFHVDESLDYVSPSW